MKKSIFTLAFVAVAAISANAMPWDRNPGHKTFEGPWKTVAIEAAEKTQPIVPVAKDYGPMLKHVALQDNVGFESHGWL